MNRYQKVESVIQMIQVWINITHSSNGYAIASNMEKAINKLIQEILIEEPFIEAKDQDQF